MVEEGNSREEERSYLTINLNFLVSNINKALEAYQIFSLTGVLRHVSSIILHNCKCNSSIVTDTRVNSPYTLVLGFSLPQGHFSCFEVFLHETVTLRLNLDTHPVPKYEKEVYNNTICLL